MHKFDICNSELQSKLHSKYRLNSQNKVTQYGESMVNSDKNIKYFYEMTYKQDLLNGGRKKIGNFKSFLRD